MHEYELIYLGRSINIATKVMRVTTNDILRRKKKDFIQYE